MNVRSPLVRAYRQFYCRCLRALVSSALFFGSSLIRGGRRAVYGPRTSRTTTRQPTTGSAMPRRNSPCLPRPGRTPRPGICAASARKRGIRKSHCRQCPGATSRVRCDGVRRPRPAASDGRSSPTVRNIATMSSNAGNPQRAPLSCGVSTNTVLASQSRFATSSLSSQVMHSCGPV